MSRVDCAIRVTIPGSRAAAAIAKRWLARYSNIRLTVANAYLEVFAALAMDTDKNPHRACPERSALLAAAAARAGARLGGADDDLCASIADAASKSVDGITDGSAQGRFARAMREIVS